MCTGELNLMAVKGWTKACKAMITHLKIQLDIGGNLQFRIHMPDLCLKYVFKLYFTEIVSDFS